MLPGHTERRASYSDRVSPLALGAEVLAPHAMRLVDDDALILELLQILGGFGFAGDQAMGHQADAARAFFNALWACRGILDAVIVDPLFACPDRRRQVQQPLHLVLPLPEQRLRRQDQHGPGAVERHQHPRHRQLQGLA